MEKKKQPNKFLAVMIGVTLAVLFLYLLHSKVVQAIIGIWLIAGIGYAFYKLAECFLASFRGTKVKEAAHEEK